MTEHDIKMRRYNKDTNNWDILYPATRAENVVLNNGENVQERLDLKVEQEDIDNAINNLIAGAPEAMNTLSELADAITSHQGVYDAYVTTVTNALNNKSDTLPYTSTLYS